MQGIILAAGRGSRLGSITSDYPKLLLEINGKTIYSHQLSRIQGFCSKVVVVLGHGFERATSNKLHDKFNTSDYDTDIEFVVINDWEQIENAATLLRGIQSSNIETDEDIMILCGDVIFTDDLMDRFISGYNTIPEGYNAVGYIPGVQNEMTSVNIDSKDNVTNYGSIPGCQEIGIFILNESNIEKSINILSSNQSDWFPIIFPATPTKGIPTDESERVEINTPAHLSKAKRWAATNCI